MKRAISYQEIEQIVDYKLRVYPYNNYSIVAEQIKNNELNMKLDYLEHEIKKFKK